MTAAGQAPVYVPVDHSQDYWDDGGYQRGLLWASALPLIALVHLYRLTISPLLGPVCKFYPSCSQYSLTALRRFGLLKGTWLTVRRLLRCHPWTVGGIDHVPARHPRGRPG